jgi:deoxyadenosine kinase
LNLQVHLDLSPEESMARIKMRARDCETTISIEYLRSLHHAYETFITEIAKIIPVIKVDYSRFRTAEDMAAAIKREYEDIANIRHVTFDQHGPVHSRTSSSMASPPVSPAKEAKETTVKQAISDAALDQTAVPAPDPAPASATA